MNALTLEETEELKRLQLDELREAARRRRVNRLTRGVVGILIAGFIMWMFGDFSDSQTASTDQISTSMTSAPGIDRPIARNMGTDTNR